MKQPNKWTISIGNDVGPEDDYYIEWWEVANGSKTFKTDEKEDAEWLAMILNKYFNYDL